VAQNLPILFTGRGTRKKRRKLNKKPMAKITKEDRDKLIKELVEICQHRTMAPLHYKPRVKDMLLDWSKRTEVKEKTLILLNVIPDQQLQQIIKEINTNLKVKTKGEEQNKFYKQKGQELSKLLHKTGIAFSNPGKKSAAEEPQAFDERMTNPHVIILEQSRKENDEKYACLYFQLYYFLEIVTKNVTMIDLDLLKVSKKELVQLPVQSNEVIEI
jgi:hypothetical protein